MTFDNEILPRFYPNIPTQKDSYSCGVYCLKYIKMLYEHSKWYSLDGTSGEIIDGLSEIMTFQNLEAINLLCISMKKGIESSASIKI